MVDRNASICRLCLEVICKDGVLAPENIDKIQSILPLCFVVLPDVNLTISSNPVICNKCDESLKKLVSFKSMCLESEKHVRRIYSENKSNLENNSGKTCRFCLQIVEDEMFCTFDLIEQDKLVKYLPELDFTLYQEPVLCFECLEELQNHFSFIISCLDVVNRIKSYCVMKELSFPEPTDLYNMLIQTEIMEVGNDNADLSLFEDIKEKIDDSMLKDIKEDINDEFKDSMLKDIKEDNSEIINAGNVLEFKDENMQVDIVEEKKYAEPLSTSDPSQSHIGEVANKTEPQLADYLFPDNPPKKEDQQFDEECLPQQHLFKGYYNNINCLDQKLKYYQDEFQRASEKFNSLKMVLMQLKNEEILSEEAYKMLMECK